MQEYFFVTFFIVVWKQEAVGCVMILLINILEGAVISEDNEIP